MPSFEPLAVLPIQLIIGLGNPGKEYAHTRHNAGAWFVQAIADEYGLDFKTSAKYQSKHASIKQPFSCHLLLPLTFMNASGEAVRAYVSQYKIPISAILVAHDDVDLPVGLIKLKFDGGNGGHNGLKSVIDCLRNKCFYRLRIGIGHPGMAKKVPNYVLSTPPYDQQNDIDAALIRAQHILPLLLEGELQKAMQELHTRGC